MNNLGGNIRMYGHDQRNRSEQERMEMPNHLEPVHQEQHISRAAKLQCRWLEVSERERQAHIYNRQLLQDFHRAQDTINDLMARTAAMNTLRVEYERHLEQLYPQWCQKLQEQSLSTQRKCLEMHLKELMTAIDDESPEAISSNSASYSFPSNSQCNRRQEGLNLRSRNTHATERLNKPKVLPKENDSNLNGFQQLPYTWLTQVSQPILRSDQMIPESRGAYRPHGVPPLPLNPPTRAEVYNSYGPVYQDPPLAQDYPRELPSGLSWPGVVEGPTAQQAQPHPYGLWPPGGLPMLNPAVWRMMGTPVAGGENIHSSLGVGVGREGGGGDDTAAMVSQKPQSPRRGHSPRHGHRIGMRDGASDRSCELDTKPVRLLGADDESSAASSTSNRSHHKRKEGKGSQRSVMVEREDTISQQSSAASQASLVPNLRHEILSRNTNIAQSSSESAEQTHSVSRRGKSTNGTQNGTNEVSIKASRGNVSITSSNQSRKSAKASKRTQNRSHEPTDDDTEENAPSVRSDRATGGEDDEDERLETDDEEDEEGQRNKGMVGKRVDKGEGVEQSEEEEVEVFRAHSGLLKANREPASDKSFSNGSQKSQNGSSRKNTTKSSEMVKDVDKSKSIDKTSEEDDDNEDDDDGDGDDDDDDNEEEDDENYDDKEQGKEEEEDGGDDDDDDDDDDEEGDSEEHTQKPNSDITKEKSISNRNNAVDLDNEDEGEEDEDEEMYNQEIEDDEEDEVVVDNGYTRTDSQKYNFLKYLDEKNDEEDDVETLLAPKVEVPKQKEMIPKVIVIQAGSESDSDEKVPEKKKSRPIAQGDKDIDSDDEFDHFYD